MGFPVLQQLPVCRHAVTITPVGPLVLIVRERAFPPVHSSPATAAFPDNRRVGSHIKLFEACSVFTLVTACRLAASPERHICLEGSDGFVTSTAAPIASGWSDQLAGWELHPLKTYTFSRRK